MISHSKGILGITAIVGAIRNGADVALCGNDVCQEKSRSMVSSSLVVGVLLEGVKIGKFV